MKFVVDANVVLSCLLREGTNAALLVNPILQLYAPAFLFQELQKHLPEILERTHRSASDLSALLTAFQYVIQVVPQEDFADLSDTAKRICPDQNDFMYFALAMKLQCPLWSNDKALRIQDHVRVVSTAELLAELSQNL